MNLYSGFIKFLTHSFENSIHENTKSDCERKENSIQNIEKILGIEEYGR